MASYRIALDTESKMCENLTYNAQRPVHPGWRCSFRLLWFLVFRMLSDLSGAQSGRKSKLVEDQYIVLCTVTINQKPNKAPRTKNTKTSPNTNRTQTHKTKNKPKENTHHRAVRMNLPEGGKGWPGGNSRQVVQHVWCMLQIGIN